MSIKYLILFIVLFKTRHKKSIPTILLNFVVTTWKNLLVTKQISNSLTWCSQPTLGSIKHLWKNCLYQGKSNRLGLDFPWFICFLIQWRKRRFVYNKTMSNFSNRKKCFNYFHTFNRLEEISKKTFRNVEKANI